eukprot:2885954-Rhodomonas_salina.2
MSVGTSLSHAYRSATSAKLQRLTDARPQQIKARSLDSRLQLRGVNSPQPALKQRRMQIDCCSKIEHFPLSHSFSADAAASVNSDPQSPSATPARVVIPVMWSVPSQLHALLRHSVSHRPLPREAREQLGSHASSTTTKEAPPFIRSAPPCSRASLPSHMTRCEDSTSNLASGPSATAAPPYSKAELLRKSVKARGDARAPNCSGLNAYSAPPYRAALPTCTHRKMPVRSPAEEPESLKACRIYISPTPSRTFTYRDFGAEAHRSYAN